MTFGEALASMKAGGHVRSAAWTSQFGEYVFYRSSEDYSAPLFFMHLANGQEPQFSFSHRDYEAEDWEEVT